MTTLSQQEIEELIFSSFNSIPCSESAREGRNTLILLVNEVIHSRKEKSLWINHYPE